MYNMLESLAQHCTSKGFELSVKDV